MYIYILYIYIYIYIYIYQLMFNNLMSYAVAFGKSANINNLATLTISEKPVARSEWCLNIKVTNWLVANT